MTTFAPSAAAASTIASPIPLLPPVTTTDFPWRSIDTPSLGRRVGTATDEQIGDEPRPAGLVRSAEAGARVGVEVLVEREQIVPGGVLLEQLVAPEDGTCPVGALQEDSDEAMCELVGHLGERQPSARAGRALDEEGVAEIAVVDAQRLEQEVVDREPDGPAPIRVSAEEAGGRLGRLVAERRRDTVHRDLQRMVGVIARERADPVRRQELALVEQHGQEPPQPVDVDDRE